MRGFDKYIPCEIQEYEVYHPSSSDELVKMASANLDLPDDFVYDPDYLYLWVRIVSAGEYYGPNKNGDYFPEEELIKYYETFQTAHVFKNHENKNVEHAIGAIISARWNPMMKCVEVFKSIDKKRAPDIARGFTKGYLTDVSMGCKVPYTICSICGNKARRKSEFCVHVNRYRMQYLGNGERVFEINYEPNFHDSSAVLNGAERVAKATVVIDSPPAGVKVAFQKVASQSGKERYVKVGSAMQKAASDESIHPMLIMQKEASTQTGLLQKLAELEKELTGKIMSVVSSPNEQEQESAGRVLDVIRFLTEKRMDPENLRNLAETMQALAKEQGVSEQKVLSVFLGLAEVMGIRLYPTELHELLSHMTDAHLSEDMDLSSSADRSVYPSEYVEGAGEVLEATKQLPDVPDGGSLYDLYNEATHDVDGFSQSPMAFVQRIKMTPVTDGEAPIRVIKVMKQTLTPLSETRGGSIEQLLKRIAPYLLGTHPIIGHGGASRDLDMMLNPQSAGDVLGTVSYRMYQDARPTIVRTKMIRLAMQQDRELEKMAADEMIAPAPFTGIPRRQLFFWGVPAVMGLSALQKNRRDHGKNLSDVENFVADHPVASSAAMMFWGKPLSGHAVNLYRKGAQKYDVFRDKLNRRLSGEDMPNAAGVVPKEAHDTMWDMVKVASVLPTQSFMLFDGPFLNKMASLYQATPEQLAATKTACLLAYGGMEKQAEQLLAYYQLPISAKDEWLKEAFSYAQEELEKVADDFLKNMVMDGVMMPQTIPGTLPGRMLDSFLVTKLMKMAKPPVEPPTKPMMPGGE